MGREVRKVPPNWKHPQSKRHSGLQPMHDQTFTHAANEWKESFRKWYAGEDDARTKHKHESGRDYEYWEWAGEPPDADYYRPWEDAEATWYQCWETVTEGTPRTPPFATIEELESWLAEYGDNMTQIPGCGWGIKAAHNFCNARWMPSMIIDSAGVHSGADLAERMGEK
jgi:hypothetical protein